MKIDNSVRQLMAIALAGLLAACGKLDPAVTPSSGAEPGQFAGGATQNGALWLEPLTGCGERQVATLHWEAALFADGPVEIRIGDDVDGALFAKAGGPGMKESGPWLMPGNVVVARTTDGTEVGRAVATGPDCEG